MNYKPGDKVYHRIVSWWPAKVIAVLPDGTHLVRHRYGTTARSAVARDLAPRRGWWR